MKPMQVERAVRFNDKQTVFEFQTEPLTETPVTSQTRGKDPLPRERRMQQLVARKAVLSFQRHLQSFAASTQDSPVNQLANVSTKFSRRAREVALEEAILNFLEAHQDEQSPRFCPESDCLNANTPVQLTEFPPYKRTRKVTLDDGNEQGSPKRQRTD